FFFQAEYGIRVFHVTGVQTCALPILPNLVSCLAGMGPAYKVFFKPASAVYSEAQFALWALPCGQRARTSPRRSLRMRTGYGALLDRKSVEGERQPSGGGVELQPWIER